MAAAIPTRRPETPEDAGFRFALFLASRLPHERFDDLHPTLAEQLLRHQFAGQETSYRAAHLTARHDIIEVAGVPVGRIVVDEDAAAWTLVDVALTPEARGRGLGTAVLRAVCDAADRAGASLSLTVRSDNPAQRLYERLGFAATRVSGFGAEMVRPATAPPIPDRLRLPFAFDPAALAADLEQLRSDQWIAHFVTCNYEGDWDVIPLRARAGAAHPVTMIFSDPLARDYVDTPFLDACPAIRGALACFRCPLDAVRLMRLGPGSVIKEHRDDDLAYEQGAVRIHVPVLTNPDVDFRLNGERVTLAAGSAWYLRLSDPHAVSNLGATDRVHLVIDVRVDPWVEALFAEALNQSELPCAPGGSMTPSGQTVCLCMIVKDEAPVIRRCLDAVRPLIDRWLIVDTGSSDGTQEIVRRHFGDLPGDLVERPWRDFAHNRSEALALARPMADYALIVDADDAFEVPADFRLPDLDADSYLVDIRDGTVAYQRLQLVSNALPWRYVGVLHEYPACEGAGTVGHLPLVMRRNHDGARRRDPDTYRRDAALLERALEAETDPFLVSRYTFYLAQSYRDCGERERAVTHYLARAGMGYWDQEVFFSLYQAAKLMEALGRPREEVLRTYGRATAACPSRIEAIHGACRLRRLAEDFAGAAAVAEPALGRDLPEGGLFVEPWIYDYGLLDEFAVSAFWSGRCREAAEAGARALASPALPAAERARLMQNRQFALDRLATPPAPAAGAASPGWVPTRPQGGTELMVEALRGRLGSALDAMDLRVNLYDPATRDARPLVVWFHHDIDQAAVQWCRDPALTDPVARFVFISYWQRERYVAAFGLRPERCVVINHAMEPAAEPRIWEPAPVLRCAYTSTPFRGLDILLDVWERLPAGRAELHVWSSMALYAMDDGPYRPLVDRARSMPGVVYHGLAPNAELRAALRTMHFLTYPNTFAETACLSVMEAMSAGCRVIVPSHGVLPETTAGYARVYPWSPDRTVHAAAFAEVLAQEFAAPWDGRPGDALDQQAHCATIFAWERRLGEWRRLIASLRDAPLGPDPPLRGPPPLLPRTGRTGLNPCRRTIP